MTAALPLPADRAAAPARGKLVFILSKFPCYDEAFLLREIAAIAARLDVHVFSLRRSRETMVHDQAIPLLARLISPRYFSWDMLAAHLAVLRRRPRGYWRALVRLMSGNRSSPMFLLKNLVLFPKAIHLANWVLENGVTHVHGGWATFPTSAAVVVADVTGVSYSFSAHAHDIYLDATHLAEKIRGARFVSTCTRGNAAFLEDIAPNCPPGRIRVLHHGVALATLQAPPRTEPGGPFEILSVGTLNPHKGFTHLLDAVERLHREGVDFRCTIVGGGPQESALKEQARRLGLTSHVTFTGALRQHEIVPYYRRSQAFVLMAQAEWHWGIPNVIIEALASHNAVVTTRFGSVEELIQDGETGLLVPAKDPGPLAAALRRLASDTDLRVRLARAGHDVVAREFDLGRTIQEYVGLFGGDDKVAARRPA